MSSDARSKIAAVFLLFLAAGVNADSKPGVLTGEYWLPEKDGRMEIYEKNGTYFGRVTAYDVADQLDEKNPNPKLTSRPVVGIDLLSGFSFDEKSGRWTGGTIYDAKSGQTYKCRLWFEDGKSAVLWARGYIGISILGRTERFERIDDDVNIE